MRVKWRFAVLSISLVTFIFTVIYYGYFSFMRKAYPIEYDEYVYKNAVKYHVDKNLIFAVIKSESNFQKDALSSAGAIGLMQIMPDTFDWLQSHNLLPYKDIGHLRDPKTNIEYGTYLLSILQKKYYTIVEVLCAYNAGIGAVDRWLENKKYSSNGKTLDKIPYPETNQYVKNVLDCLQIYKNLY